VNLLFITATRIGDAVLSSGVLGALIARHPGAGVTIACGPAPAPLFADVPGLARIVVLEKRPLGGHWLGLWRACAGVRWDLVVDLRNTAASRLLRARTRHVLGRRADSAHQVERLAAAVGLSPPPAPRLWLTPAHRRAAAGLVGDGTPVLALGVTANWRGKLWPAERFVEIGRRLTAPRGLMPGGRIAVLGAASERALAQPVLDGLARDRVIDLVGRVDLPTAGAALERCALFIGNDSGLMHIAAAAGTPTLGLFGPSRDEHYAPWGPACAVVRTKESFDELIGRPGYDHRTTGSLMGSLTVDAVEGAADMLWRRLRAAAS
jgi:heptosyltransferase-3